MIGNRQKYQALYVEGRIPTSNWEDEEGVKRYSFEISGDNLVFIDGKREEVKEDEGDA